MFSFNQVHIVKKHKKYLPIYEVFTISKEVNYWISAKLQWWFVSGSNRITDQRKVKNIFSGGIEINREKFR